MTDDSKDLTVGGMGRASMVKPVHHLIFLYWVEGGDILVECYKSKLYLFSAYNRFLDLCPLLGDKRKGQEKWEVTLVLYCLQKT